jgi:hypothetical protein
MPYRPPWELNLIVSNLHQKSLKDRIQDYSIRAYSATQNPQLLFAEERFVGDRLSRSRKKSIRLARAGVDTKFSAATRSVLAWEVLPKAGNVKD